MKIYAAEDGTGRRRLVRVECDASGCCAMITPGPHVIGSGWVYRAQDSGPGTDQLRWDYCPEHAHLAEGARVTPSERHRQAQALHRLARALGVELLPEVPLYASLERLADKAELVCLRPREGAPNTGV